MALILQIETSTISCSVALSQDGETIALKELAERNIHASHITLYIEDVMAECRKDLADLDAVAVSMGPGSYTGLRIGISTAKGLCYGLDIPLIAISTLKAMTYGCRQLQQNPELLYCPMIDARRMEVYTAVFNNQLDEIEPTTAKIIDSESFAAILEDNKIVFFGDGAMKCDEVISKNKNALFLPDYLNSAKDLSQLAYEKFMKNDFEDIAYFEPYYLKDFLVTQPKSVK